MEGVITIRGARLHNLKNIDLYLPKNKFIVLTGLSGSGKSTLAFDLLYKESQRLFMEALGMVSFGLSKPPVDELSGLPPSVSVEQRLTNTSPRSTVGTSTDVYTYLRVLFARVGKRNCPNCGQAIPPTADLGGEYWQGSDEDGGAPEAPERSFPCPHCGAQALEMSMASFSFNKPAGACPACTGLGTLLQVNLAKLADEDLSFRGGAVRPWDDWHIDYHSQNLQATGRHYGFDFDPDKPLREYSQMERDLLFYGVENPQFRRHFPGVEPPDAVSRGRFEGAATNLMRRYAERIEDENYRAKLAEYMLVQTCPECLGARLKPESRQVMVGGHTIVELSRLSLDELAHWLEALPGQLTAQELGLAQAALADLYERMQRLLLVGAGYLSLDRASPTLSAGEAQRLRLAALVGSSLSGVLYVFDEPTIGLHPRDTQRLIQVLRRLVELGNTVLVVEHDLDVMRAADVLVDIGPGAGKYGGWIVAQGTPDEVTEMGVEGRAGEQVQLGSAPDGSARASVVNASAAKVGFDEVGVGMIEAVNCQAGAEVESITAGYLAGKLRVDTKRARRKPNGRSLTVVKARMHNLQDITVGFPLGLLTVVSGVSGSGKSSLVFDILERAGRARFYGANDVPGEHQAILGWEDIERLVSVGQEPMGRMPRSNAATYTDIFTPMRELYARQPEAARRGFTARQFSFNVPGGRCERCEGAGVLAIPMHFLPDVQVRCPVCHGRRFTLETLAVKVNEVDIAQALELTAVEALEVFGAFPAVAGRLKVMCDTGLGYLQLGQPADTLSGGEAQRVKLAKELGRRGASGRTLYLLDEPTIGLHSHDVARLLEVLGRLVDAGNTVVMVEHNLDMIRCADWVIDLGPEGGAAGGRIVAQGTPEQVAQCEASYTGRFLRALL